MIKLSCPMSANPLAEWNDSPFVSSYPNYHQDLDSSIEADQESSHGQPWHFDVEEVVTGDMVATGSFGMVFKGIYRQEKVAVKVLLIPEASSKEELIRVKANFLQEIQIWYTLKHPNVVRFVGAYIVPPRWAIVTEFLDGGSLRAYLTRQQRRKLPTGTIKAMALDIARGMSYLHENHIIHRDLKSANLLLDGNGMVKVADFGLARFEAEDPGNLTAETGTIRWMAPELICHEPYDRKIDVYSYGIVLWELCTSLVPYEGMSFVQLAHSVATDHHRPPTRDLPPSLVKLMRQCWDKDAAKRPDFADIVKYFDGSGVWQPKASHQPSPTRFENAAQDAPGDQILRRTESLRGGRVVGRTRNSTSQYGSSRIDDALSDDEEWVSIRRQCRCAII